MAIQDFSATTTTTKKADYTVPSVSPNSPVNPGENFFDNPNFTKWFGKYVKVPKIKKAIDGYADWVLGLGYTTDDLTLSQLDRMQGNGKESFDDILWNAIVTKKVAGESYVHVIRNEEGTIINMRNLNNEFMRVMYTEKGKVKEYRYHTELDRSSPYVTYTPFEILHFINDKVVDEMHGRSVIEPIEWNVEAQEEAKRVHRKLVWRSGVIRVIEVDTNNATELATLKAQYQQADKFGDVLILPKDKAKVIDWKPNMDVAGIINWLNYLDNEFYVSIGFPRDLSGASTQATEAGMKMSYMAYYPLYINEVREIEQALWSQQGIMLLFNKQQNISDNVQSDEAKNTGQTNIQREGQ